METTSESGSTDKSYKAYPFFMIHFLIFNPIILIYYGIKMLGLVANNITEFYKILLLISVIGLAAFSLLVGVWLHQSKTYALEACKKFAVTAVFIFLILLLLSPIGVEQRNKAYGAWLREGSDLMREYTAGYEQSRTFLIVTNAITCAVVAGYSAMIHSAIKRFSKPSYHTTSEKSVQ